LLNRRIWTIKMMRYLMPVNSSVGQTNLVNFIPVSDPILNKYKNYSSISIKIILT
jgi:hypothetical protein